MLYKHIVKEDNIYSSILLDDLLAKVLNSLYLTWVAYSLIKGLVYNIETFDLLPTAYADTDMSTDEYIPWVVTDLKVF
jgi:hypothetical protein